MDDLTYTLRALCQRNRDGSHATQADRLRTLTLASLQLRDAGFRQMRASSLKGKHVAALWAADWVRRRRSKDFTRLALMPCAWESDVAAPVSLLEQQYDRSSSRKFQSLGNCANPHCCCSRRGRHCGLQ